MATVTAGMTMSLDGFVEDADGSVSLLYPDLADLRDTDYMNDAVEETGAVLMGRHTFEMGDPDSFVGEYEFQVPIFVVTQHPPATPPKQDENLTFTFVTDGVASGAEQAKAAAGDKVVQVVGGPMLIRELLNLGLVDDLRVDVMPVFLGGGLRLFENVDPGRVRLQKRDVREVRARTSLGFRVVR